MLRLNDNETPFMFLNAKRTKHRDNLPTSITIGNAQIPFIYIVLFFLHNCPLLIPLHNTAVHIKICRFLINVVKFMQTLTKLDLPTLRKGSTEERTQRNK